MHIGLLLASFLTSAAAFAQDDVPGPPATELADPEQHADAVFGTDVSLQAGAGSLLGEWTVPGVHTTVGLRFDAFATPADAPGPRLGLSIFGERAMGLLPRASEEQSGELVDFPFGFNHFGALCALRSDPAMPWGGNAALGFSRMDLEPYYGGSYPVPVMLFEGGMRRHIGRSASGVFADLGLRAGWTQLRNPSELLEDLWTVQLQLGLGAHIR